MGMNAAGGFMSGASEINREQMRYEREKAETAAKASANGWTCSCGNGGNTGKFCSECGAKKPEADKWTCSCGNVCSGKFCSECGAKKPEGDWTCSCGNVNTASARFCSECGSKKA
jgi:membrane protease subunit (stomatin/prohibitin family)